MSEQSKKPLNQDVLKYLAVLAMGFNHFAIAILVPGTALFETFINIGYFTSITMCYFLVEGFGYTHSKSKYAKRLFVFALISQVPYTMALGIYSLNMLFTLLICFGILILLDLKQHRVLRYITVLLLIVLTTFTDWPYFAALFTIFFYKAKGSRERQAAVFGISALVFGELNYLNYNQMYPMGDARLHACYSTAGILLSGILILGFYNGRRSERGRTFSKWFFYAFYPGHLVVLWLLGVCLSV